MMKKILYTLALATLLYSCDDGDLVIENLSFDNTTISKCGNNTTPTGLLFKVNGSELLLINIPANYFDATLSTIDAPKVHTLTANQLIYRKYSGSVNANIICSDVPPATPTVSNEWLAAAGGTIEIVTSEKYTINEVTGISVLTGYSHDIRFKNVLLSNAESNFVYDDYYFGEYITNL